jgi:hypothetical protein
MVEADMGGGREDLTERGWRGRRGVVVKDEEEQSGEG